MFLELEISLGQADLPDSIMDRVLEGLVSETSEPCFFTLFMNELK